MWAFAEPGTGRQRGDEEMRSKTMMRSFVAGAFVVGFGHGWAVKGGDSAVEAQAPHAPFMMQRIYAGTDGLSHVENIELDAQSVMEEVTGMSVRVSQPGSFADWHVGPGRRYIINLTGGGQLEVGGRQSRFARRGDRIHRRSHRRGHTTAHVGDAPRVSIHLEFADQNQIVGPIGDTQ